MELEKLRTQTGPYNTLLIFVDRESSTRSHFTTFRNLNDFLILTIMRHVKQLLKSITAEIEKSKFNADFCFINI